MKHTVLTAISLVMGTAWAASVFSAESVWDPELVTRLLKSDEQQDLKRAAELVTTHRKQAGELLPLLARSAGHRELSYPYQFVLVHASNRQLRDLVAEEHNTGHSTLVNEILRRATADVPQQNKMSPQQASDLIVATMKKGRFPSLPKLQKLQYLRRINPDLEMSQIEEDILFGLLRNDKVILRKSQTSFQSEASQSLWSVYDRVEPRLWEGLQDESPEHRVAVIGILSRRNAPKLTTQLMTMENESNEKVRRAIAIALGRAQTDQDQVASFLLRYAAQNDTARQVAIQSLATIAPTTRLETKTEIISALLAHIDAAEGGRRELISNLLYTRSVNAVCQTLKSLDDEAARTWTEKLIPQLGDPAAIYNYAPLVEALETRAALAIPAIQTAVDSTDPISDKAYLAGVLWAIEQKPESVLDIFIEAAETDNHHVQGLQLLRRMEAHAAPAVPKLCSFLSRDNYRYSILCMSVLREIGPQAKDAIPVLKRYLGHKSMSQRYVAMRAIAAMGCEAEEAVPALVELLSTQKRSSKIHAIRTLGKIGPSAAKAIPALEKELQSTNARIVEAAREALAFIQGAKSES